MATNYYFNQLSLLREDKTQPEAAIPLQEDASKTNLVQLECWRQHSWITAVAKAEQEVLKNLVNQADLDLSHPGSYYILNHSLQSIMQSNQTIVQLWSLQDILYKSPRVVWVYKREVLFSGQQTKLKGCLGHSGGGFKLWAKWPHCLFKPGSFWLITWELKAIILQIWWLHNTTITTTTLYNKKPSKKLENNLSLC